MRNHAAQLFARTFAPTRWAIAPAALYGLVHGATFLKESVDVATAWGIAGFISLAIGPWLAVNLDRCLMRGYSAWMASIVGRLNMLQASTPITDEPVRQERDESADVGVVALAVGYSFYVTIFCFGGFASGGLLAITTAQIQGIQYSYYLVATVVMFGVLAVTIAAQCLYLGFIQRKVSVIEAQRKEFKPSVHHDHPLTRQTAILTESISRTERFGCRVVGVRPISIK